MSRSSAEIQKEITTKFGFFPPFFGPALATPDILENLWQQTLSAYLNNPLPALFKEKLAAVLARYCTVPYCLMCHSSSLSPLGMSSSEVLQVLETAPLNYNELSLITGEFDGARVEGWPQAGSKLEEALLSCCVSIFLGQDAELCQKKLKSVLEPNLYQHLNIFLAYNRTALSWAEMNPELSSSDDKRVQEHFQTLVTDEPRLTEFFENYHTRVITQGDRKSQWLSHENKRILESERERVYSYLAQAPIGFAVLEEPDHRFVMANKRYEELIGKTQLQGLTIRNAIPGEDQVFFDKLDSAYLTGKGSVTTEKRAVLKGALGGDKIVYVNVSVEPYRNPAGAVSGLLIVLNEVTEQVEARRRMNVYNAQLKVAQQELNLERHRLSDILSQIPVGICLLEGPDHRYTFANQEYRKFTFVTENIIGKTVREAFPELEGNPIHAILKNTYESGQRFEAKEFPFDFMRAGGVLQRYYLDFTYEATRDQHQVINGIAVTVSDSTFSVITRKKVEASESKLRDAQTKFNAAMTSARTGTWSIDLKTNEVTTSENFAKLFGHEVLDGNIFDAIEILMHPEDRAEVNRLWQYAAQNTLPYVQEYRVIVGSGETRWVLSQGATTFDAEGDRAYFAGILSDITDRKISELALATEQHTLETIFKESPVAMALYRGHEFVVEKANLKFESMLGNRNIVGRRFEDAFPELAIGRFLAILQSVFRTGEIFTTNEFKINVIKTAGMPPEESYWDFTYARTVDSEGHPYGVYFVGSDVTDRVHVRLALESARQAADHANEAKSSFLANMSHEIRSPLGSIMGFSDLLKGTDLSRADVLRYVSVIDRNSTHLLRIIDDILDLAKVEAGKMMLEHIDFSLHDLLADFSSLMEFRARDKGIEFEFRTSNKIPSHVNSDPTRVRQILANIVGNAIKFTEHGLVQLTVSCTDAQLRFEVSDTGPGLTPDEAEKLFQPFHQADISTTRKFGGSGLGLVLTRRISEALGGTFTLERSTVGQGSVFVSVIHFDPAVAGPPETLAEPIESTFAAASSDQLTQKTLAQAGDAGPPLQSLRVLVVDDAPDNQELFKLILSKAGAAIDIATNGSEGLNAALTNTYDVVLMDVQMPVMDGHQATQILRKKGYRVPIIALTAHAMSEEKERAAHSGFTDFLSKPVDRRTLIAMLKRFLPAGT